MLPQHSDVDRHDEYDEQAKDGEHDKQTRGIREWTLHRMVHPVQVPPVSVPERVVEMVQAVVSKAEQFDTAQLVPSVTPSQHANVPPAKPCVMHVCKLRSAPSQTSEPSRTLFGQTAPSLFG